jgi:GNAT superfamily N-acetyltransferase
MKSIEIRVTERFPEPEFSQIQRVTFRDVQDYSAQLAEVIRVENRSFAEATSAPALSFSPTLRLGAYSGEELVAWSFGWLERGRTFYMANSGVTEPHRRQGLYSKLVGSVCERARSMGAVVVRSQHSVLNNPVIVAKLKLGFQITGLSQSAQMGSLVELSYHLSEPRQAILRARTIPFTDAASDA